MSKLEAAAIEFVNARTSQKSIRSVRSQYNCKGVDQSDVVPEVRDPSHVCFQYFGNDISRYCRECEKRNEVDKLFKTATGRLQGATRSLIYWANKEQEETKE